MYVEGTHAMYRLTRIRLVMSGSDRDVDVDGASMSNSSDVNTTRMNSLAGMRVRTAGIVPTAYIGVAARA